MDLEPRWWHSPLSQEAGMARYFFHLHDGRQTLIDPEGREIEDRSAIGDFALREARAMISQDALGGKIDLRQFIEVRDDSGKLIHQLSFRDAVKSASNAPGRS
jgi:hypothetical protein